MVNADDLYSDTTDGYPWWRITSQAYDRVCKVADQAPQGRVYKYMVTEEQEQRIIDLYHEGHSYSKMAKEMGLTIGQISGQLNRLQADGEFEFNRSRSDKANGKRQKRIDYDVPAAGWYRTGSLVLGGRG